MAGKKQFSSQLLNDLILAVNKTSERYIPSNVLKYAIQSGASSEAGMAADEKRIFRDFGISAEGAFRLKMKIKSVGGTGCKFQLYKNGILNRTIGTCTSDYVEEQIDVTAKAGDYFEIYGHNDTAGSLDMYIKEIYMYYDVVDKDLASSTWQVLTL